MPKSSRSRGRVASPVGPEMRLARDLGIVEAAIEARDVRKAAREVPNAMVNLARVRDAWLYGRAARTFADVLATSGNELGYPGQGRHGEVADRIDAALAAMPASLEPEVRAEILSSFAMYLLEWAGLPARALPVVGEVLAWERAHQGEGLPTVLLAYARCLAEVERWGELRAVLDEVAPMVEAIDDPDLPGVFLELSAVEAAAAGDDARAITLYVQAGEATLAAEDRDQAADFFLTAASLEPDDDRRPELLLRALRATDGSIDPALRGVASMSLGLHLLDRQAADAEVHLNRALALGVANFDYVQIMRAALALARLAPPDRLLTYLVMALDAKSEMIEMDDEELPAPYLEMSRILVTESLAQIERLDPGDRGIALHLLVDCTPADLEDLQAELQATASRFGIAIHAAGAHGHGHDEDDED